MSDLAKQYAPSAVPGLIAGTAASYTAGAGTVKALSLGETSVRNADLGHDYKDDRTK